MTISENQTSISWPAAEGKKGGCGEAASRPGQSLQFPETKSSARYRLIIKL